MPKHWTSDEVLTLARSYQEACVVAAAADLDLFAALAAGPQTAEAIARRLHADLRGMTILLDALAALELVEKAGEHYALPSPLKSLLAPDRPATVLPMAQHQANCLRRWAQLAQVVKTGQPAERQPSIRGADADEAAFIGAMHSLNAPVAAQVLRDIAPLNFNHVLDIGGASGTWTIELLELRPTATATIFDLPHVIPLAEQRLAAAGLRDRVRLVAGDFYVDALPGGADLAWVSAIVHQNSRAQNRALFQNVHAALVPSGRILVRDVVMESSRTAPVAGALFAVNMLVGTEAGGTFTFDELRGDLESAGFEQVTLVRRDEGMNAIVGATRA